MKKLLLFVLMFFMSGASYLLAQSAVTGKVTDENGDGEYTEGEEIGDNLVRSILEDIGENLNWGLR